MQKVNLVEEKLQYYLIHIKGYKWVNSFPININPEVNIIPWREFELSYFEAAIHHFIWYASRYPGLNRCLSANCLCKSNNRVKMAGQWVVCTKKCFSEKNIFKKAKNGLSTTNQSRKKIHGGKNTRTLELFQQNPNFSWKMWLTPILFKTVLYSWNIFWR